MNAESPLTPDPRQEIRTGSLLVIFLTVFVDLLGFGIVLPLLPLYADQFSFDEGGWMIGLLMASFSIMQFVFAPIWGSLSDRFGRRPIIIVGLAGSVLFYTLFGVATIYESLAGLFITRIGAGIAGATIPTAQAYIADSTTRENRARGMALIGMAFGLGFTIGPLFAYFAITDQADSHPGPGPGFVAAGLSAVALLMALFMLPESRQFGAKSESRKSWIEWGAWREAFSQRAIGLLLAGFFICLFSFSNFETTLSMLLRGPAETSSGLDGNVEGSPFRFSFRQVCLMFAGIGFLVAFVQGGIVRPLAKTISERTLAVTGAIIEVFGFAGIAWAVERGSFNGLVGALIVVVAGYACLQPSLFSLLSRWSDPEKQGRVLGVGQSVSALARIFGSALGIPMLKVALFLPYAIGAVLMLSVAILIGIACRTGRDYSSANPDGIESGSSTSS